MSLIGEEHILTATTMRRLVYRRELAASRYRAAFARTLGITDLEMQALVHLAEQGALAPSAIASILGLSSGGATALVQRLERAGHVTRHPHPTDRRSILIRLSEHTADRLTELETPLYDGLEAWRDELGTEEQRIVITTLERLASLSEELEASLRRDPEATADALSRPVPSLWA